jgi:hypothetical protein
MDYCFSHKICLKISKSSSKSGVIEASNPSEWVSFAKVAIDPIRPSAGRSRKKRNQGVCLRFNLTNVRRLELSERR